MASNTDQQRAYNEYMNAVTHNGRQYYQPVGYGQPGGIQQQQQLQQPQPNPYQPQQPNPYQQPSAFGANGTPFPQSQAQYGSGNFASLTNDQLRNLSGPATVPVAGVPPAAPMPPTAGAAGTPGATLNRPGLGIPPPSQALGQQAGAPPAFGGFPHGPLQGFPMQAQPGGFQAPGMQMGNPQMMGHPSMASGPPPPLYDGPGSHLPHGNAQRETTPWKSSQTYFLDEYPEERYLRARPPPPGPPFQDENLPPPAPMLLPHTCSECGRMRSAAFHRQHPVAPGEPTIPDICGRCRRRGRGRERCVKEHTHVRKCIAEEPCDWPDRREPPMLPLEHRGRMRSRSTSSEEMYMEVRRSESRNGLGLRVLQDHHRSPSPRRRRTRTHSLVRVTSLSPSRPRRETVTEARYYRRSASQSPPRRERRVRTPSPPPILVRRARTPSPIRSSFHRPMSPSMIHDDMPRGFRQEVERRIVSHPARFRPIEHSPPRGILKDAEFMHETSHRRRMKERRSQESTMVDVGGPRVQFVPDRSESISRASFEREHWRDRVRRYEDEGLPADNDELDDLYRRRYHRTQHVERSPSPPTRRLEELHIRHEERSPSPPARRYEEVRVRHVSPPPSRGRTFERGDIPYPRPVSLERRDSIYRGTSHVRAHIEESDPPSPPRRMVRQLREKEWEELTATERTESDASGDVVSVRRYRKLDENGRPGTWEEVRRTHYIDGERERERERERVHVRPSSFRDV